MELNLTSITNQVKSALDKADFVDLRIKKAIKKNPERARFIHSVFMACIPIEEFNSAPEIMYKAHVNELIDRAIKNLPLNQLTYPEIVITISEASLKAPLSSEMCEVAFYCINKFSPNLAQQLFGEYVPRFESEIIRTINDMKNKSKLKRDYDFTGWDSMPENNKQDDLNLFNM